MKLLSILTIGVLVAFAFAFLQDAASWTGDHESRVENYCVGGVLLMAAVLVWRFL